MSTTFFCCFRFVFHFPFSIEWSITNGIFGCVWQCMCSTFQSTVFFNQKMREIPRQIHLLHYPKIHSFCMVERHCHSSVYYNYSPVCVCYFFLFRFRWVNRTGCHCYQCACAMCTPHCFVNINMEHWSAKNTWRHWNAPKFACIPNRIFQLLNLLLCDVISLSLRT